MASSGSGTCETRVWSGTCQRPERLDGRSGYLPTVLGPEDCRGASGIPIWVSDNKPVQPPGQLGYGGHSQWPAMTAFHWVGRGRNTWGVVRTALSSVSNSSLSASGGWALGWTMLSASTACLWEHGFPVTQTTSVCDVTCPLTTARSSQGPVAIPQCTRSHTKGLTTVISVRMLPLPPSAYYEVDSGRGAWWVSWWSLVCVIKQFEKAI